MKIYREYRHITVQKQRRVFIVTLQLCCPTGSVSGAWTILLWRAAYASELASWRTSRLRVVGDWGKSYRVRVWQRQFSYIFFYFFNLFIY